MSDLAYTLETYLTAISISTKKRVLVEGRYDRQHINNLLSVVAPHHKIHVDAAQYIKSSDRVISKNNRMKVEVIHSRAFDLGINNVFFLCDREFRDFTIDNVVKDELDSHYVNEKLHWTFGHSMENYFFHKDILIDAYKYMFSGENKNEVFKIFEGIIDCSFKLTAAITLASRKMDRLTFPLSIITWKDFLIDNGEVNLKNLEDLEWTDCDDNHKFYEYFKECFAITSTSSHIVCSRFSRGHTAMIMLQRIFSACIFYASQFESVRLAGEGANKFSSISEDAISNALSESWVRKIDRTQQNYPVGLFDTIIS